MFFITPTTMPAQTESPVRSSRICDRAKTFTHLENMGTYGHFWEQMGTQPVQNLHPEPVEANRFKREIPGDSEISIALKSKTRTKLSLSQKQPVFLSSWEIHSKTRV